MAGYNADRLQCSSFSHTRPSDDGIPQPKREEVCELPLTLSEMMARAGSEMLRPSWRAPPDLQRPLAGVPHLVSDNSGPETQLSRIVELEIIPRLMLLHGGAQPSAETPQREVVITAAHVETLTHLAIDGEADRAEQFVTAMIASGAPLSQVFLQLLAPAARLLGLLWEEDVYSFAQVTVGLWRLQQILHEQSRHSQGMNAEGRGHRLLLAHQPGSRHTFGVAMLSEFFTRDGWQVDYEPQCQWSDLNAAVSCGWYDVLGVSIGTDDSLVSIASAILTLRTVSRNKRLIVMVGGPAAQSSADLAERCGADCMALDATAAISMANRWMESVARIG